MGQYRSNSYYEHWYKNYLFIKWVMQINIKFDPNSFIFNLNLQKNGLSSCCVDESCQTLSSLIKSGQALGFNCLQKGLTSNGSGWADLGYNPARPNFFYSDCNFLLLVAHGPVMFSIWEKRGNQIRIIHY